MTKKERRGQRGEKSREESGEEKEQGGEQRGEETEKNREESLLSDIFSMDEGLYLLVSELVPLNPFLLMSHCMVLSGYQNLLLYHME